MLLTFFVISCPIMRKKNFYLKKTDKVFTFAVHVLNIVYNHIDLHLAVFHRELNRSFLFFNKNKKLFRVFPSPAFCLFTRQISGM